MKCLYEIKPFKSWTKTLYRVLKIHQSKYWQAVGQGKFSTQCTPQSTQSSGAHLPASSLGAQSQQLSWWHPGPLAGPSILRQHLSPRRLRFPPVSLSVPWAGPGCQNYWQEEKEWVFFSGNKTLSDAVIAHLASDVLQAVDLTWKSS